MDRINREDVPKGLSGLEATGGRLYDSRLPRNESSFIQVPGHFSFVLFITAGELK